ncbi:MAG: hypothetical protein ACJ794_02105 [Gemmatimonadaceae bacterium]
MAKPLTRFLAVAAFATAFAAQPAQGQEVRGAGASAERPALEKQFRQRLAKLAQERIGLTDAQMAQLEQSNARYAPQLNKVAADERDIRRQLRQELTASQPNQQRVGDLLDASLRLQKQRIDIVESEQRDLAKFMTPVQRARYIALQQQFRQRARELAGRNGARGAMAPRRAQPGSKKLP